MFLECVLRISGKLAGNKLVAWKRRCHFENQPQRRRPESKHPTTSRGQGPEPRLLVDRPWATFQNTFTYLTIPSTTVSDELCAAEAGVYTTTVSYWPHKSKGSIYVHKKKTVQFPCFWTLYQTCVKGDVCHETHTSTAYAQLRNLRLFTTY
jgi:hypothetical protein